MYKDPRLNYRGKTLRAPFDLSTSVAFSTIYRKLFDSSRWGDSGSLHATEESLGIPKRFRSCH